VKKLIAIVFFLSLFIFGVKGQTYFDVDFGNDSSSNTIGGFIHEFSDTSGYLAVGAVPVTDSRHLIFIRLDEIGDTIWTKMYGTPKLARSTNIGKFINIGDTNLIFTGNFYPDSVTQSPDTIMAMLINIDTSGNVIWERYYGDTLKITATNDVQATSDGGYIITGFTTGWGAGTSANSFLLKVDSLGFEEWHQIYTVPGGVLDIASSVDTTNDGGYIISGEVRYSSPTNQNDMYVIKTDNLGNLSWVDVYGSPYYDVGYCWISKVGTNDYLLAGGITVDLGNGLNAQVYLAKINGLNGSVIWADSSGTDQFMSDDVSTSNPVILSNGDIMLTGVNNLTSDALLHKYNSSGTKLWDATFDKYGLNNLNQFFDVHQTIDNGFIITGDLTDSSIGEQRLWVVKLDSVGCQIINCSVGVEDNISEDVKILVYPNPSNTIVNFELSETSKSAELFLFDVTGKKVLVQKMNSYSTQIDVSGYPKGIYFYQLIHHKERFSGKLVIN
jgi:hypothetical protein